jgi:hypothetical protein
MNQEVNQEALRLAELAGIRLPAERVAAFAASLEMSRRIGQALARVEYGEIEPAAQFRAPRREG